jgi:hypothetical protein
VCLTSPVRLASDLRDQASLVSAMT